MSSPLRRLASDTVVYGVSTIAGRFLTFLLTPMYTNYLTTESYGEIANLYVIIAFLGLFCSLGFESAFIRYFSQEDNGATVFSTSFSFVALAAAAVAIPLVVFAPGISPWLGVDVSPVYFQMAVAIVVLDAVAVVPYAMLRMLRKSKQFALSRFATIVINVALNVWFVVFLKWGIDGIFWAGMISSASALLLVGPTIVRWFRARWDTALLAQLLKFGLPTVPAALAAIALQLIDRPLIKELLGDAGASQVGIYQACYRLAIPMMIFVTVFDYAWKPFFMDKANRKNEVFVSVHSAFAGISMVVFLLVSWFAEYIVRAPGIGGPFFNPAYWGGLEVIPPVLMGYAFHGMFVVMMSNVYYHNKTHWLPVVNGIAAVVNLGINLALIPYMGIFGAALATTAAYLVEMIVMANMVKSLDAPPYKWLKTSALFCVSIALWYGVDVLFEAPSGIDAAVKVLALGCFAVALVWLKFIDISSVKHVLQRRHSN